MGFWKVVAVVKQFALVAVLGAFADYLRHVTNTISVGPPSFVSRSIFSIIALPLLSPLFTYLLAIDIHCPPSGNRISLPALS